MASVENVLEPVTNAGFDLAKENINGLFNNMTLLTMMLLSLNKDKPFPKTSNSFNKKYDYIIVGAGPAGCVMANRLTQKFCVTVLLLEAGEDTPIFTDIPAFATQFRNSSIDWQYLTTPQKYCAFGQTDRRVVWNSGKVLGGGSTLNAMLYVRGNKEKYDCWEEEGCSGWAYKDVLPYFKKFEDNQNLGDPEINVDYHGGGEPLTVEKPKYEPEIKKAVLEASATLGYDLADPNGRRQTGIYDLQATMRNGQRCSAAKAYLVPAEDRPNLTILKGAYVTKILIKDYSAYGVEFDFQGKSNKVFAKKEVIISAGTVRTAQLLMLAGIGPKKHLKKFKIPLVANLPVGKNLQDHYGSFLAYKLNPLIQNVLVKIINPVNIAKYLTTRSGPIASPSQITVVAFMDGPNTTSTSIDSAKQELYFAEYAIMEPLINKDLKPENSESYFGSHTLYPSALYACVTIALQPHSRGEILLNSTDPHDIPIINPNYYQDQRDLKDVIEGMKVCKAVAGSPALKKIGAEELNTTYPECEKYRGNDDKFFGCVALSYVDTNWHPVGTARMGQPNDPRSVVDPQLRVIGVKNLRVINAAVMPIIPSGNTNVPTMMIAEKAYDMMKDDKQCKRRICSCKRKS